MIKKKPGKIGELVHEYTVYHYDEYRRRINFAELKSLIDEIIVTNEIATLIITPMYSNYKTNKGVIWDHEDFSISMSDNDTVTKNEIENEISDIREKIFSEMSEDERYVSSKTVRLISKGDIELFQKYLVEYIDFLFERLPKYYNEVAKRLEGNNQNNPENLAFGYLGFEVINGNLD